MKAKQIFTIIGVSFMAIGFVGLLLTSLKDNKARQTQIDHVDNSKHVQQISISGTNLDIEFVNTPQGLAQGLSGRDNLKENTGMLFDLTDKYEYGQIPKFWMKDMLFDLDMIWIANDQVVYIHKNVPAPKNNQAELPRYSPDTPVEYILEVPAGWSDEHNVEVGDQVVR